MPKSRKSIEHLKLTGSYRKSKHGDREEPLADEQSEAPPKPAFLKGAASSEWDRMVTLMHERGVLSLFDLGIMTQYCLHWQTLCNHHAKDEVVEPLPSAFHNNFRIIANELGLTPASRSKVPSLALPKKKPKSSFPVGRM